MVRTLPARVPAANAAVPSLDENGETAEGVLAVRHGGALDGVGDENCAVRPLGIQEQADDERVQVDAVGDDLGDHLRAGEDRADGAGAAVVERRHGVEDVGALRRAPADGGFHVLGRCVRVSQGDKDVGGAGGTGQCFGSGDFGGKGDLANGVVGEGDPV